MSITHRVGDEPSFASGVTDDQRLVEVDMAAAATGDRPVVPLIDELDDSLLLLFATFVLGDVTR